MKKQSLLFLLILCSSTLSALTIPSGTFYYDNSKTQYSSVKFVYGTNTASYVVSMPNLSSDTQGWSKNSTFSLTMNSSISGIERYFFSETALADGTYNKPISTLRTRLPTPETRNVLPPERTIYLPDRSLFPTTTTNGHKVRGNRSHNLKPK